MPKFSANERINAEGGINCTGVATFTSEVVRSMANIQSDFVLDADNVVHRHKAGIGQAGTAVTERRPIYVCLATGGASIVCAQVQVTQTIAAGAATVTLDIYKNGVSILTSAMSITNATTLRQVVLGTLTATTLATGDVLEQVITATAGGGTLPVGILPCIVIDEKP